MRKFLLALLMLGRVAGAGATTVADLCAAPGAMQGGKPCACTAAPAVCRFTGATAPVTSGSTLDFGSQAVELAPGAKIQTSEAGNFTILASSIELQATRNGTSGLLAPSGTIDVRTTGDIAVRRMGGNISRIAAGDASTGITLDSTDGQITIDGLLDTSATVSDPFAGDITLTAHHITITGDLDVRGGLDDSAGSISISTVKGGNIVVTPSARVLGTGERTGADVLMDAEGSITCEGLLDLKGVGGGNQGGDGGTLGISALDGNVLLGGTVRLNAASGASDFGAAGEVDLDAGGTVTLSGTIDQVGPPAGNGGYSYFSAGLDLVHDGTLLCSSQGVRGDGGSVEFDAGRTLILGNISCTGGDSGVLQNYVYAEALCDVTLPTGRTIDTRGPRGDNTIVSGAPITINGRMLSAANTIQYGKTLPTIARNALSPATPGLQFNAALGPCPPPPACPNGVAEGIEQCDDNNTTDGDGCDSNCTTTACGNGIKTDGETCDDGDAQDGDGCDSNCTPTGCGNGIQTTGEECDLGSANGTAGAPCRADCTIPPPPGCGDGNVDDGEQCDDGANGNGCDGCSDSCLITGCGNGNTETACGEACDDQNTNAGDGCSATCQVEVCGNGVKDEGEQCDDGAQNGTVGSTCSSACEIGWCGNGIKEGTEACDDANTNECDGCDITCRIPATQCPTCTAGGSANCIPCTGTVDCDPLLACGSATCAAGVCTPVSPPSCDDGNGCTTDACDPARGCVSTPVVCNDATACDGTATCDPASGQCVSSTAPDCDDQDACTDDACSETSPGFQCSNQLRPGLDGVTCRLSALRGLIDGAGLPKATARTLRKQASVIARKLPATEGSSKKALKAKRQVAKGLKALTKTISKARARMPSETFAQIDAAATRFGTAFAGL